MPKEKRPKLKNVGTRIRTWRKSIPMKSFELAKLLGVSQGSLSEIENNLSLPSATTIAAFYEYTDLSIVWMLTGKTEDNMDRPAPKFEKEIMTIHLKEPGKYVLIKKE